MPARPQAAIGEKALLQIQGLHVASANRHGDIPLLHGIDVSVPAGSRVGIVGESGSGKSMTANAILRLLPPGVLITGGSIRFAGRDLLSLTESEFRALRGREISIVYQNALASLNPLLSVGQQVAIVCRAHTRVSRREAWKRSVELLESLGIPNAPSRSRSYPHQFSGGMVQRVLIAMALICNPKLLIADEPTTGLDATIQAQVLEVIDESVATRETALLLISHDLSVIRSMCELVTVIYAGFVLERGRTDQVMTAPLNPYTQGLVRSMTDEKGIAFIPGRIPDPGDMSEHQCPFAARCPKVSERCRRERPRLREVKPERWVACHNV